MHTTRANLDRLKRLSIVAGVLNGIYIIWLAGHVRGVTGLVFFGLEFCVTLLTFLFVINHWSRRYELLGGRYSLRSSVDVFIATINEPEDMVADAIAAATAIHHPRLTVYVLDDGHRPGIAALAVKYRCRYIARPNVYAKPFKAGNLNYALERSHGDFILTLDADSLVSPKIIDDLLGHFRKPKVAMVASRQSFWTHPDDFNHDHLFYGYMQTGKNQDGAAISCGTGVIYRRAALQQIGGFSEWNVVEDLTTTYEANQRGLRAVYVSQPYVEGFAPTDLSAIYKQRGTWALDTLRLWLWRMPLFNRRLNRRQRLHYFELGYIYVVSGVILPSIFLLNYFVSYTNQPLVTNGVVYVLLRLPALFATLYLFGQLSQGQISPRMWAGLFPVYAKAFFKALCSPRRRPPGIVTPKITLSQREVQLVFVQLGFLLLGVSSVIFHLVYYGADGLLLVNLFWLGLLLYWLVPVIEKGLNAGRYAPRSVKSPI